jgi:cobaltochelatase CobN
MHHIYGDEVWGIPGEYVFELNLAQIDAIVHNQNSNLYGFIDNDDVFQYVGGLACAYKAVTGEDFDSDNIYATDNSDLDSDPTVSSLHEVISKELRTRYWNPKWIEGMMGEGYAGAREMTKFVEYLWGWEATVPGVITDDMWQGVYDVYVGNAYGGEYDIGKFASVHNPYAYQSMTARMLETIRKGGWTPSSNVQEMLVSELMESVVQANGPCCCINCCGNPLLDTYIAGLITTFNIDPDLVKKYNEIRDAVAGKTSASSDSGGSSSGGSSTYPLEWEETPARSRTSLTSR